MTGLHKTGFNRRAWLALAVMVVGLLLPVAGRAASSVFDHFTTGFELLGQHRDVACEACHVGGIFKGTPHDCFSCHAAGSRIGATAKPTSHILSGNDCSQCHTPFGWKPVAKFNHMNVIGTCSSCHNTVQAIGKPSNHIATAAECSTCHLVSLPWKSAHFDHAGVTGNCASCHDNVRAPGQPPKHVPSKAPCESCHSPSNFTTFAGTPMNHAGITNNCQACHETGMSWYGLTMVDRPTAAQDPMHPTATSPNGADCSNCHSGFNVGDFGRAGAKPANHIPTAPNAACGACHKSSDFAVMPSLTDIHAYAPSTTGNCQQCHGSAAASFAIPAANFSIVGLPTAHMPNSVACESCHVGANSSIPATPVVNGAKFSGSAMNHAGLTTCAGCHGPSVTTFTGITRIVVMPATSPAGPGAHIPSGTACESCHLGSVPAGLVPANATKTAPGTAFAAPVPTTAMIHNGITGSCSSCHESGYQWMGMASYPISPSTLSGSLSTHYLGFNNRPAQAGGQFTIADGAHPTSGDCSLCHTRTDYFDGSAKPANHIPTAPTAQCADCHKSADVSVMPALVDIHTFAPSKTSNCAQCHGSAAASFAIPSAGFSIVGVPTGHVPTTASCEACHVGPGSSVVATPVPNGAKFSGSAMSHAGITSCASCHGPSVTGFTGITSIVVMPATSPAGPGAHIPSSTVCESCHLGSTPKGLVPANATKMAPGTAFATPVPTTGMIHAGVSSGCTSCHEAGTQWMGMASYPITPAALTGNPATQYFGFHDRPGAAAGAFTIADAAHPKTGDCTQCHGRTDYFEALPKPANHIPTAPTAQCGDCHKAADFGVIPSITDIHAFAPSQSSNCAQCHGSAAASFAIPAAGFSIVGLPSGHIPTTAACESCHVGPGSSIAATPVVNGAKFSGSKMNHAGITTCVACHGPTVTTFTGISKVIVMPPVSPAGPNAHIPSGTACESCHLGSMPSGLIAANATLTAPGTAFATPIPTTAMVHNGVSSGCSSCHDTGDLWMGQSKYPIAPTVLTSGAQYTGFHTRPVTAASTFSVADGAHPTSGDCSQCHTGTTYFDGQVKPSNHIPTSATAKCADCHKSADFSVLPALADIHTFAPSQTTNCAQCHGSAAASFAIPAANFSIVGLPTNHIPTTAACESCHVGAGSSVAATPVPNGAKFSGSKMNHAGLTTCVGCHGPSVTTFAGINKIVVMPATSPMGPNSHIPSGSACESCHAGSTPAGLIAANATLTAPGTAFATPVPTTAMVHSGISTGCSSCHDTGYRWMDQAKYPIAPTVLTSGAQYTGFHTRPVTAASTFSVADAAHPTTGDCSQCHTGTTYFDGQVKPSNHIPTAATAQCTSCHKNKDFSVLPALVDIHTYAPSTTTNCAQCHGSAAASFAIPAANFSIVGLPTNHIPTTASCEACHVGVGSSVATTPVPNGAKFSGSKMSHAGLTTCVGCHGPSVTTFAGINKIVVMPATSPMGPNSHIPSGTACETCHAGSAPAGLIAANATLTAPGTAFATPVPTTAMIHAGIASGCTTCHEGAYQWMDMARYPIAPAALTGNPASQYTGFQTRPGKTASTYVIADAQHPTTGDCASCHGTNFNYFDGQAEPANHIPTTSQTCSICHTTAGNFAVYTTNLTTLHSAVSTTCSTCHADGKGPFAGSATFKLIQMSTRGLHIPITRAGAPVECSGCHKSVTAFTGTIMSHGAIGDSGTSAAGNACDACHEYGFSNKFYGVTISKNFIRKSATHEICGAPGTPTAPNITICSGGGSDCLTGCHEHQNNIPSKYARVRPGTPPKQIQAARGPAPPAAAAQPGGTPRRLGIGLPAGRDALAVGGKVDHSTLLLRACQTCHNGTVASGRSATHPATTAACGDCHSTMAWTPVLRIDHADVVGNCAACHNGTRAAGKSASHPPAGNDCDRCHTTSAWKPAAFDHAGIVAGTCSTCHNALQAPGKPASHVVTTLSCDSCHYVLGWKPVKPPAKPPVVAPPAIRKPLPGPAVPPRARGATLAPRLP